MALVTRSPRLSNRLGDGTQNDGTFPPINERELLGCVRGVLVKRFRSVSQPLKSLVDLLNIRRDRNRSGLFIRRWHPVALREDIVITRW